MGEASRDNVSLAKDPRKSCGIAKEMITNCERVTLLPNSLYPGFTVAI